MQEVVVLTVKTNKTFVEWLKKCVSVCKLLTSTVHHIHNLHIHNIHHLHYMGQQGSLVVRALN
jgi:hypothetical protein